MSAIAGAVKAMSTGRRRWLALGVIGIAQLMVVLDLTVMNIALPSAQRALHFTTAHRPQSTEPRRRPGVGQHSGLCVTVTCAPAVRQPNARLAGARCRPAYRRGH
jgi:hypothetical protein